MLVFQKCILKALHTQKNVTIIPYCFLFQHRLVAGHYGHHGYLVALLVVMDNKCGIGHVSLGVISALDRHMRCVPVWY